MDPQKIFREQPQISHHIVKYHFLSESAFQNPELSLKMLLVLIVKDRGLAEAKDQISLKSFA